MTFRHQISLAVVPTSDDGAGSEERDGAELRDVVREVLEELRERMERDGRFIYEGRWRTREEIRALRWQILKEDLARLRDIVLVLLVSVATVVVAYQFLLFLFP